MAARSTQTTVLARSARRAVRKVRNHGGSPNIKLVKELGERLSVPENGPKYAGPDHLRELRDSYRPADDLPLVDGRVPLSGGRTPPTSVICSRRGWSAGSRAVPSCSPRGTTRATSPSARW